MGKRFVRYALIWFLVTFSLFSWCSEPNVSLDVLFSGNMGMQPLSPHGEESANLEFPTGRLTVSKLQVAEGLSVEEESFSEIIRSVLARRLSSGRGTPAWNMVCASLLAFLFGSMFFHGTYIPCRRETILLYIHAKDGQKGDSDSLMRTVSPLQGGKYGNCRRN